MMELNGSVPPRVPSFNHGLGLIQSTPPVSFIAAETPASQRITSFQESLKRTPTAVSTPDVINAWSESLRGQRPPARTQMAHSSKPSKQDSKKTRNQKMEQPTHIPKPKTVQTGPSRNHYKMVQEKHKTLPIKKGLSSSARRQVTTTSRKDEVISPLAVDQRTKAVRTEPRRIYHKDSIKTTGKPSATDNVASQIIGALSADKPDSRSSSSQSSRSSTPKPQALDDPLEALNETAFVSRDLLARTPAPKADYDPSKRQSHSGATTTQQENILNNSGGLLGTILDQVMGTPSLKTVRTALFSSPDDHHGDGLHGDDYHGDGLHGDDYYADDYHSDEPHGDDEHKSMEHYSATSQQQLLPPFAFQTPGVFNGDSDNVKQAEFNLLTPFSFVTQLSAPSSSKENQENGFSPLTLKLTQGIAKEVSRHETPKVHKLIEFTPLAEYSPGSAMRTVDHLQTPLGKMFEDKLSLSKEQGIGHSLSAVSQDKAIPDHGGSLLEHKGSKISLFEPTVVNESLTLTDNDEQREPKRSPFGALDISDEDEPQEAQTSMPVTDDAGHTALYKGMQQSDLMSRLNRIKAAQRYDFKYLSPNGDTDKGPGDELQDVAIETLQAKRLDQIKEAQQGQQVTPGSNTQGNVEPYRGTEGALLTPLTASSAGSPENGANELVSRFPYEDRLKSSNISTPTSMLSERFLMKSPDRRDRGDVVIFSLDSPVLPGANGLSSPEEATPPEMEHYRGGTKLEVEISARTSEHLWNSVHSPIPSSLRNDNKMTWFTTNEATPKDLTQPNVRRLSYEDFLNESVDTSFLVQDSPHLDRPSQGSYSAFRSPNNNHLTKPPDKGSIATVTSRSLPPSPAIGHLIDF